MDAVVLAAGLGSRLRPLTLRQPKPCVSIGAEPILEHQLHAYATAGIEEVVVVAGYRADDVRELCASATAEHDRLTVSVVENSQYESTDNKYSFSLAQEATNGGGLILTNGDVVLEPEVLQRLTESDAPNAIACDTSAYDAESMKITVDDQGQVEHLSKEIEQEDAYATSIDCYRFSPAFTDALFSETERRIETGTDRNWTEAAIDSLLDDFTVRPVDIAGTRWVEVDDHDDLHGADQLFSSLSALSEKQAVFFDLDGTLYLGEDLVSGAAEVVKRLREHDVAVYFLSNNSSAWRTDYAAKLGSLGIPADPEDVILSTDGVIDYLKRVDATEVCVVGTQSMIDAIRSAGLNTDLDDATEASHIVVGFDTELTYEKTRRATLAIRDGAEFLLAHPDPVCPTPEGLVPDCGAIGALIKTASGEPPARTFGKPNTEMIAGVLEDHDWKPEDVAIVGDRLETEIEMADRLGCESVCVLTGDATRVAVEESSVTPTLITSDVSELLGHL